MHIALQLKSEIMESMSLDLCYGRQKGAIGFREINRQRNKT